MKIDAKGVTLDDILEAKYIYEIPDYQRPYSWTKDEINDLINDLRNSIDSKSNHYFGAFVFNTERKDSDQTIEVIDGQQRITTVFIFLYAIITIYKEIKLEASDNSKKIDFRITSLRKTLILLDEDGEIRGSKLILGDTNKDFYNEYIVEGWDKGIEERAEVIDKFKKIGKYEISKSISTAYEIIYDYLVGAISNLSEAQKFSVIKEYHDRLLKGFEVVKIEVVRDSDAFLIFETLNDRGLELSAIDLIKNRLFKNCSTSSSFDDVKNKWTDMTTTLGDVSLIKKYLKHYWIAFYEQTNNQTLFVNVRNKIKNDANISEKIIKDLNLISYIYSDINYPNESNLTNKKLINSLEDMNQLGYDLTHPIILSGFKKFANDEEKLFKLVKLCLNFLLRYITIMKEKPGSVEKDIGECARSFKTIEEVAELFGKYAKDSEFKERFKTISLNYKSEQTYYILVEYEKTFHHNEVWVTPGRKDVTVEHILPQTINFESKNPGDWGTLFTKEEAEVYVNRLGNLTLLGTKGQPKSSNKNFDQKRNIYKSLTDMKATVELFKLKRWTKKEIEARQTKMAEAAVDIFTLEIDKIK